MTREEAIRLLTNMKGYTHITLYEWLDVEKEALDMAIEALSAVCDDCIWHVCNYNKVDWDAPSAEVDRPTKHTLPDGTETHIDEESYEIGYTHGQMADRQTGHIVTKCSGKFSPTVWAECSECGKPIDAWDKFCRHCGAKMGGNTDD